jgi:hypothetical protein
MSKKQQKIWIGLLLFVSTLIFIKQSDKSFHWLKSDDIRKPVVISDGTGYYAYLPQVFIYQEKGFLFIDRLKKTYPNYTFDHCLSKKNEQEYYDKYFIGTSLCISPFFLAAHGLSKITGKKVDGYSYLYQLFISFAAFSFWLIACIFLFKTLRLFDVSAVISLVSLGLMTFATNLNYYVVFEPCMSHVYSFGAIAAWIYFTKRFALAQMNKHFIISCLLLGLIILIRPVNGLIVILFPFLFSDFKSFKSWIILLFREQKKRLLLGVSLVLVLIALQYVNVYLQMGEITFGIYVGEKFIYLNAPKIWGVLFSFRKGLFMYSPFLLLPMIGFVTLFRRNMWLASGLLLFLTLFIYITASWWCWYYGGSFGMRPFVDVHAVFVLLLAFLLNDASRFGRLIIGLFSLLSLLYSNMLLLQHQHAIIHYSQMNEARFWKVFMKTDRRFEWCFYVDEPTFSHPEWNKMKVVKGNKMVLGENGEFRVGLFQVDKQKGKQNVTLNFKAKISEDANPTVSLYRVNNGVHYKVDTRYFGWHIPELSKFSKIEQCFAIPNNLQKSDSLYLLLSQQAGQLSIKDFNVTHWSEKKN